LLVSVYAGLVLLATRVLPFHSAVAVALSTLICAALFAPVRRRVQHTVDRRFNRSQYNAEKVVAAFTVQLQHHVGLEMVQQNLISVGDQAFQPTQVAMSLIREPGLNRRLTATAEGGHLAHQTPMWQT
jgi:small basic protein